MNLLLLNHNLREHGTYFRAFHFGHELVRMGHRVTLLTASPDHWYRPMRHQAEGVEIIETPSWNPFVNRDDGFGPLDAAYRSLLMIRRRWDACYTFAHPPNVFFPHWIYRIIRRGPVAVDWCDCYAGSGGVVERRRREYHDYPLSRPRSVLGRLALRSAWCVEPQFENGMMRHAPKLTVISRFLEQRALQMGVSSNRLLRLPSGAPVETIRPMDKQACRARLGIPEVSDRAVIVYVANYHHDEDFILESLRCATQRAQVPMEFNLVTPQSSFTPSSHLEPTPWMLYVVGPPFREGRLREFGLSDCVREVGRQPFSEVATWLGAADLLFLPYPDTVFNRSRWPNKIGDYLAAGRPTITNATGDFAPLFKNNDIGIAAPGDPDAYGRAITDALASQPRWDAWSANARRLAETDLAWNRLAEQLARFWLG